MYWKFHVHVKFIKLAVYIKKSSGKKLQDCKKNIDIRMIHFDFMEHQACWTFLCDAKYGNALAVTDFGIIHPAKGQRF